MNKSYIWNADNGDGTYVNPILYTDYSDPDAIRVGDDYYMVASSFSNAPGLPLLHSKDMVNWEIINYCIKSLPLDKYDKPIHGCGVWAPSIRFHEGVFYVCFPMPDDGIYMCTATDPRGEWSEPINIRPGAGWIDPCPFWDDDGKAYLVAGVAKSRIGYKSVLHIVEMSPDGMSLIGDEIKVFDGNENDQHTIEGPKLYKRNGWYYIFAPAGGVKEGWQTVLRSKNIYGPYEYRVVMRQGNTKINGPHQGAWLDTSCGEDYFLHFQDVYAAGRIIHLQPMRWVDDWPVIGEYIEGREYGEPIERYHKPNVGAISLDRTEPVTSDDFTDGRLNLAWQWNANSKEDWYGFEHNGLLLNAVYKEGVYADAPNLLLQKWPAPEFSCVTKLRLSNLRDGDEAGIISFGMSYGLVSFQRKTDSFEVKKVLGKQIFEGTYANGALEEEFVVDRISADTDTVYLKYYVERDGRRDLNENEKNFPKEKVTILYGYDGINYEKALEMVAEPGRWVGTKNGVFCLSNNNASQGHVVVESVTYRKIYHNPVKRGFFPDPSITRVGSDYYMVNSTFQYFPAIAISHSTDLVNWEIIGHAITNSEYLDLSKIHDSHGIWAPDIEYVDGQFVIMATLRLNGKSKEDGRALRRQLVVTSKNPEGPYSEPTWIEVDDIDPSLFVDDDGKKYMCISPGLNLVELDDNYQAKTGEKICVWPGTGERCPEGPHLMKHGEYYYAILAEGGTGYGHGINVARSKNIFGPYEASPYNPLLRQNDPDAPLQRCGHGKLIQDSNLDWWVFYLCGRPNGGHYTTIGRETALEPVKWLDDGWFVINNQKGPSTVNDAPNLPALHPSQSEFDGFDSPILDLKWEFVRNPEVDSFSLSERPGWCRIWTQDGVLSEISAKNILLRREQELSYTAETKLEFYPKKPGEQAGITCYYSTATYARFSLEYDDERIIKLVINRNHGEEIIASVGGIKEQAVYLRVNVQGLTRGFDYSYDGEIWFLVGKLDNCIYLCDEGVPDDPKRHTGTLVGIYANNGGTGSRIAADFDYFCYSE